MRQRNSYISLLLSLLISVIFTSVSFVFMTSCATHAPTPSATITNVSTVSAPSSIVICSTTTDAVFSDHHSPNVQSTEHPTNPPQDNATDTLHCSEPSHSNSTVPAPPSMSPEQSSPTTPSKPLVPLPSQSSSEQNTTPSAIIHSHKYNKEIVPPSCLQKGYTTYTCTGCSYSYSDHETDALGHNYNTSITAPTCTKAGNTTYTCSRCKDKYTDNIVAATGHNWTQWTVITSPTTTSYGQQSRKCISCSKTETHGIPPLRPSNSELQQEVLRLVNIERQNAGLPPLSYCYEAQEAADIRVSEIQISYGHTRPNGKQCYTVIAECGIDVSMCGENIAFGFPSPQTIVEKWMESPGHRANILNKNISSLVVGVSGSYWVQLFIK